VKPTSEDMEGMKNLFTQALGEAAADQASLLVNFGGGDRVMLDYGRETDLVEMAESLGMQPLAICVTGPEPDDFEHIVSLWRSRVFRPQRSILVLNQHLVGEGRSPEAAFRTLVSRPELEDMTAEGLATVMMPRMPCMTEVSATGLGLTDAIDGVVGAKGAQAARRSGLRGGGLPEVGRDYRPPYRPTCSQRRALVLEGLARVGLPASAAPDVAFYATSDMSGLGLTSEQFCERALEEAHVALTPGKDFGADSHVRTPTRPRPTSVPRGLDPVGANDGPRS
jgi:hypothetical protein